MLAKILNSKAKTVGLAALLLAGSSLLSRVLGLLRDNLLANLFPKNLTDVYFTAFRIPDFLYGLLITGGVAAAFLPVFAANFKKDSREAETLVRSVLTFFLLALVCISAVLAIFTPRLVHWIAPGFSLEQQRLTVSLSRIMFLSPIFLGASAIITGLLQYFNLFLATALAPIAYNAGIIIGILFFAPRVGLIGLAFGVILGAVLHLLVQIPALAKTGFSFRGKFKFKTAGLKKILVLMAPRTVGAAAYQFNLVIVTAIASTLTAGSISVFNFANNIQSAPVALIGVSFATAVFPFLSRTFVENDREKFLRNFSAVFSHILFLIIPISALVFLLRAQIVRLILGTSIVGQGFFGWSQTRLTAASLGIFALSLFAAALIPFLARVFFSVHNTKTPVKIALLTMALNIFLCYGFVWLLGFDNSFRDAVVGILKLRGVDSVAIIGLVLSFSLSAVFQFCLLCFWLKKKIAGLNFRTIFFSARKIVLATLLASFLIYLDLNIYSFFFKINTVAGILGQAASAVLAGCLSYIAFSRLLGIREMKRVSKHISRLWMFQK